MEELGRRRPYGNLDRRAGGLVLLSIDPAVEADLIAHVYVTETFWAPGVADSCERVVRGRAHSEMVVRISLRLLTSRLIIPQRLSQASRSPVSCSESRTPSRARPLPGIGGGDDRRGPA